MVGEWGERSYGVGVRWEELWWSVRSYGGV